ncbi:DUF4230 domain-containing protein [Prevotella aurantiaca]|uniref:DUF4230 domain-containing protein n=1 Tax=Prevotella aurantiaca TaxID=596085 RepID=UPI0028DC8B1E|nr:DUF4230 domain-containing protein [Prevotella aurantiaca]
MSNSIQKFVLNTTRAFWLQVFGVALLIGGGIWLVKWLNNSNSITVNVDQRIDITPQQIQSIQSIGQWEFLAINDEEIVDTVRERFFSDNELVRIYYGTLRLGIDLHKAKPRWLHVENDSVVVATLPNIELLDRNFIDEARTQSFFESGNWSAEDREKLYNRAYQKMLKRCFTKENIAITENNARKHFEKMLNAMGYKNVRIEFENKATTK